MNPLDVQRTYLRGPGGEIDHLRSRTHGVSSSASPSRAGYGAHLVRGQRLRAAAPRLARTSTPPPHPTERGRTPLSTVGRIAPSATALRYLRAHSARQRASGSRYTGTRSNSSETGHDGLRLSTQPERP